MAQHGKMVLIFVIIIILLVGTLLPIYASEVWTTDLVVNGGFEDGRKGWEFGPLPHARGGVDITNTNPSTGSYSLRLIGGGVGFLQKLDPRSIYPSMQLSFYTFLNSTAEEWPQALFHLYFLPTPPNGPQYYVDITITPANSEDLAAVFEPNPGIEPGGIYLRFNREPKDSWIHISVDISKLLERYLPDFFDPQINQIMLESAESGKVYFDDISLNATNLVEPIYLAVHYIWYSTIGRTISELLGYSVIITAFVWIYHRWRALWREHRNLKRPLAS